MKEIGHTPRFMLVSIKPQKVTEEELLQDLEELKSLVEVYGGEVHALVVQSREVNDKGRYIGTGKVEEVATVVAKKDIDVVVLNAVVPSGHIFDIKKRLITESSQIKVWDRVDLILHIFDKHATSSEAKLQIEMASMRHMGPRIYGMGMVLSQQGGGIGSKGIGETNTELMQRHWRSEMKKVQDKIKKHTEERTRQLERRSRTGIQTVSIIGYTNAGKTSLFNLLTGKKNTADNALFVTLDSATGKIYLPNSKKEILITDTIGFIKNLPTTLIDAFKSTLMESIHADLLLLVIDSSDDNMKQKIKAVENVLNELKLENKKRIYVFNKIDKKRIVKKHMQIQYKDFNPHLISVQTGEGIEELMATVEKTLAEEPVPSIDS